MYTVSNSRKLQLLFYKINNVLKIFINIANCFSVLYENILKKVNAFLNNWRRHA